MQIRKPSHYTTNVLKYLIRLESKLNLSLSVLLLSWFQVIDPRAKKILEMLLNINEKGHEFSVAPIVSKFKIFVLLNLNVRHWYAKYYDLNNSIKFHFSSWLIDTFIIINSAKYWSWFTYKKDGYKEMEISNDNNNNVKT